MKNNILPEVWGPHGWKFMHYVALGYPDLPTDTDKSAYQNFYESLRDVLPCQGCATHYKETILQYPVKDHLQDRESLLRWSFEIHNTVNKRVEKPTLTYEDALQLYTKKQFPKVALFGKCVILLFILLLVYYVYSRT